MDDFLMNMGQTMQGEELRTMEYDPHTQFTQSSTHNQNPNLFTTIDNRQRMSIKPEENEVEVTRGGQLKRPSSQNQMVIVPSAKTPSGGVKSIKNFQIVSSQGSDPSRPQTTRQYDNSSKVLKIKKSLITKQKMDNALKKSEVLLKKTHHPTNKEFREAHRVKSR